MIRNEVKGGLRILWKEDPKSKIPREFFKYCTLSWARDFMIEQRSVHHLIESCTWRKMKVPY